MTHVRDMRRLHQSVTTMLNPGPDKWAENAAFVTYVRQNALAIADVLLAAAMWDTRAGGLTNQELKRAVRELPEFKREEA